jgi:hypothetical protein
MKMKIFGKTFVAIARQTSNKSEVLFIGRGWGIFELLGVVGTGWGFLVCYLYKFYIGDR